MPGWLLRRADDINDDDVSTEANRAQGVSVMSFLYTAQTGERVMAHAVPPCRPWASGLASALRGPYVVTFPREPA
jgi:hypothetical protein